MRLRNGLSTGITLVAALGCLLYALSPEPPMPVVTQVYGGFQQLDTDGSVRGTSVEVFRCAMRRIKRPYTLAVVDSDHWEQAQRDTRDGAYAAFFGGLWTRPRSEWAALSNGIEISRAYYIRLKEPEIDRRDPDARWGVKSGSGVQQTVPVPLHFTVTSTDNTVLVRALLARDIDWLYMDVAILRWAAGQLGLHDPDLANLRGTPDRIIDTAYFHLEPAAEQIYGVWISREWLARHPGFLDGGPDGGGFNDAIGQCRQGGDP